MEKKKKITKKEYQSEIVILINKYGYWSKQVFNFNNKCICEHGYYVYKNWFMEISNDLK